MYKLIGEADSQAAFLESESGFDVAILHRVTPDGVPDQEYKAECLTDDAWQKTINLVDAAPRMYDLLKRFATGQVVRQEEIEQIIKNVEETF